MICPTQRWREGRTSYRGPDEPINTRLYEVDEISEEAAKQFVTTHHYSHSFPASRGRFGLFHRGDLVGCAVFSHPMSDKVVTNVFPVPAANSVDLGRFVLLDFVPGNGETWFLARCFELLRRNGLVSNDGQKTEILGAVSFSDPFGRSDQHGRLIHRGHVGTIYQAFNGVYLGQMERRTIRLLPDGSVLSARTMQKIRARERGFNYASELLRSFGADEPWDDSTACSRIGWRD